LVDGKVSGRVAIPAGMELAVTGSDGDSVLVEFGNSPQKIPKANTNFAEALEAEAEAAKQKAAAEPEPEPKTAALPTIPAEPKPSKPAPQILETKDIDDLLAKAGVLETLAELRLLRSATEQDTARAMRSTATKWNNLSAEAGRLLSSGTGSPAHIELLKKFLEASEMADPKRLQMFEAKLREIDTSWIKLKTGEKIQALTDGNPEALP
jgi:hypothetical protein